MPHFQVFPPALSDLPPPMLDLFDLDETFSSEKVRLAQLTNKCEFVSENDIIIWSVENDLGPVQTWY